MRESETTTDAVEKRLATLIGLAGRQWRRAIDLRLQEFELTEATWMPLVQLARSPEPLRQRDVAAALSLDSSSVVRVLANLESAGLIVRGANEADRRAKAIVLTDAGRDVVRRLETLSIDLERELVDGLAPSDVAATRKVLDHICQTLLSLNGKDGKK